MSDDEMLLITDKKKELINIFEKMIDQLSEVDSKDNRITV